MMIDVFLLALLVITALAMLRLHDLFAIVMLSGLYSLVSAVVFVNLDAVDVAFTEAAVGGGLATILMLGTLALTGSQEKASHRWNLLPLALVAATAAALIYGTFDMPAFGDAEAPVHSRVTDRYLDDSGKEIGVPNVVTSVLASYRGFDTLGETTVVFTAAVAVLLLLGQGRRRTRKRKQPAEDDGE
jgi:multicomponent Na+:H+ antiporter subunit B